MSEAYSTAAKCAPLPPLRCRDAAVRYVAVVSVNAFAQRRMTFAGALQAVVRQVQQIRESRVGQREGGGVRHRRRHVRHAVVQHAIHESKSARCAWWRAMFRSSRPGRWRRPPPPRRASCWRSFRASPASAPMRPESAPRPPPGRQSSAFSPMVHAFDASVTNCPLKMSSSSRRRFRLRSMMVTCAPMPSAIFAALVPTMPPPRITTLAGATPGTPPSRMPRPPVGRFQILRAHLHGHASRHFAHRREQRQRAIASREWSRTPRH